MLLPQYDSFECIPKKFTVPVVLTILVISRSWGLCCTISIVDAEAKRTKVVGAVSVRGTGILAIYTCHDSDHIIHWIIALCQFILTGAAGKQGSPQCRYCEKLYCFHLAMFLELWAMPPAEWGA